MRNLWRKFLKMRLYARVGLGRLTPRKAWVMARYWIMNNCLGRHVPWLIELSVTYRCQCKCVHCSVGKYLEEAGKRKKEELTGDEIRKVLREAVAMGIPKVDYFGGEPLIRDDIIELIRYGEDLGIYMSLTTNALNLNREVMEKLEKSGVSCLNISIDSINPAKHDRLRGIKGTFDKAIEGFKLCAEFGIPSIFSTYVTKKDIEAFGTANDESNLKQLIDLARECGASGVRILFPILSGKWESDKKKEFTDEEKAQVIDGLDPSFAFIEGAYCVVEGKKVCQSLSGRMFNISPYGDVQLCVVYPQSFANVREMPLADCLKQMYSHPLYVKNKDGSCCSTTELTAE